MKTNLLEQLKASYQGVVKQIKDPKKLQDAKEKLKIYR